MIKVHLKPPKKSAPATTARKAAYEAKAKYALPHIQVARDTGVKNAVGFAAYLNSHGVLAPTNNIWTESTVLRCLRYLKKRGLDTGSLTPHQARKWPVPRKPRVHVKDTITNLKKFVPSPALVKLEAQFQKMKGN